jgi:hypothetical protein
MAAPPQPREWQAADHRSAVSRPRHGEEGEQVTTEFLLARDPTSKPGQEFTGDH